MRGAGGGARWDEAGVQTREGGLGHVPRPDGKWLRPGRSQGSLGKGLTWAAPPRGCPLHLSAHLVTDHSLGSRWACFALSPT